MYVLGLVIYFFIINLFAIFLMKYDKVKAINNQYRVNEKTLFLIALILGGIGIYIGMYLFRHKTKHVKFTVGIPLIIILNILTIYYLISHVFIML
jgi:putative membrane protein